jgi:phosphotransferase system IIB component
MTQEVNDLIIREKKLSFALRLLYACAFIFFASSVFILFCMASLDHDVFLFVFLGALIIFAVTLYIVIVSLLNTHRKIASNYQQIFEFENVQSFDACKDYFKNAGFLVYEDESLIIANKLLLQGHKGFIKRDYLIQIVVTSDEISLENYMETHQKTMQKYFEEFQTVVAATKNKVRIMAWLFL